MNYSSWLKKVFLLIIISTRLSSLQASESDSIYKQRVIFACKNNDYAALTLALEDCATHRVKLNIRLLKTFVHVSNEQSSIFSRFKQGCFRLGISANAWIHTICATYNLLRLYGNQTPSVKLFGNFVISYQAPEMSNLLNNSKKLRPIALSWMLWHVLLTCLEKNHSSDYTTVQLLEHYPTHLCYE